MVTTNAPRDGNRIASLLGVDSASGLTATATIDDATGGLDVNIVGNSPDTSQVTPITPLTLTATTAETTLISAQTTTYIGLSTLVIANTSATVCQVDIRGATGGTIYYTFEVPANDTRGIALPKDVYQATKNNNWTAQADTSVSSIIITGSYSTHT